MVIDRVTPPPSADPEKMHEEPHWERGRFQSKFIAKSVSEAANIAL